MHLRPYFQKLLLTPCFDWSIFWVIYVSNTLLKILPFGGAVLGNKVKILNFRVWTLAKIDPINWWTLDGSYAKIFEVSTRKSIMICWKWSCKFQHYNNNIRSKGVESIQIEPDIPHNVIEILPFYCYNSYRVGDRKKWLNRSNWKLWKIYLPWTHLNLEFFSFSFFTFFSFFQNCLKILDSVVKYFCWNCWCT